MNDAAYAEGVRTLHERLKVTGWQVQIWGAEQGCAIDPSGEVFTWISPNLSDVPWDWDRREVRWHWILYTPPEDGHKIRSVE